VETTIMTKSEFRKYVLAELEAHQVNVSRSSGGAWILERLDQRLAILDIGDLRNDDLQRLTGRRATRSSGTVVASS
jgi:hypothetical protein